VEGPAWSVQFPQELLSGHAPPLTLAQETHLRALAERVAPDRPLARQLEALVARAGEHAADLKPLLASRHPSQLYQAVAEGLVLGLITWAVAARPRRPGVVGCVWLIGYGLLRILTEFWRLPDVQFLANNAGHIGGLSRGQWLSAVMVLIGAVALVIILRRRGTHKAGGWLGSSSASAA
jgi:phosphatidylglycerol:prolipoprotein diacylglycerol transferase